MPADLKSILKIEVPLCVQIATRPMRVREVASLAPGAIIELPKLADDQLEITIGGRRIGMGSAVKVGENFGVRITCIGSAKQRISALGPQPTDSDAPMETASASERGNRPNPDSEDEAAPAATSQAGSGQ